MCRHRRRLQGAWQGFPVRFDLAEHRGDRCMVNLLCMGLILAFRGEPTPHRADDSLSAVVNVDMLDRDFLLTFAPVTVQGLDQGGC
jgi:hypothetical protein